LQVLNDGDNQVRATAIEWLGKIGGEAVVGELLPLLKAENYLIRAQVAKALGYIRSETVVTALGRSLEDENSLVRQMATKSLDNIASDEALSILQQARNHENSDVREWATAALSRIDCYSRSSQSQKIPKLAIASWAEARELLLHPIQGRSIKYVISLGSPEVEPPPGFTEVTHRLRLNFNDISSPGNDPRDVLPAAEEIERAIAFAATVSECEGNLLVHCQAGISRSSAIALTVLAVLLGEGKEAEAMAIVMASRPQADPNPWIVELADLALGRNGKLVEVAQNSQKFLY